MEFTGFSEISSLLWNHGYFYKYIYAYY